VIMRDRRSTGFDDSSEAPTLVTISLATLAPSARFSRKAARHAGIRLIRCFGVARHKMGVLTVTDCEGRTSPLSFQR